MQICKHADMQICKPAGATMWTETTPHSSVVPAAGTSKLPGWKSSKGNESAATLITIFCNSQHLAYIPVDLRPRMFCEHFSFPGRDGGSLPCPIANQQEGSSSGS